MRHIRVIAAAVTIALAALVTQTQVSAKDLGGLLKDGAIIIGGGALVKVAAGPINDFINTVTFNKGLKADGFTKVVPIVSIGNGTHIGAAQVGGVTKSAVDNTQAVAQLETEFNRIRIEVLIPIDNVNPLKQFKRVQGVGVTAIIDVKL